MLLNDQNKHYRKTSSAAISLRVFAVAVFVSIFFVPSISVKAVNSYSDTWFVNNTVVETDPESGEPVYPESAPEPLGSIVGCGVSEADYDNDWELQSISVETTLRSPNGQSITMRKHTWGCRTTGCSYFARIEPSLPWDWNDTGDFTIRSHHYSTCPSTELGYTSIRIRTETVQDHYAL